MGSMLGWGCAQGAAEPPPQPIHDESGAPVLATLHTKDSELTITGHGGEVRYSLLDSQGNRRDNLTLEEVLAYDENLYEVVKFAMAQGQLGKGEPGNGEPGKQAPKSAGTPFIDARVHEPSPSSVEVGSRINALLTRPASRKE